MGSLMRDCAFFGGVWDMEVKDVCGAVIVVAAARMSKTTSSLIHGVLWTGQYPKISIDEYRHETVSVTIANHGEFRWDCYLCKSVDSRTQAVNDASVFGRYLLVSRGGEIQMRDMRMACFLLTEDRLAKRVMEASEVALHRCSDDFEEAIYLIARRDGKG